MLVWIRALCFNPSEFATGSFRHQFSHGRTFHYSDVPRAQTRVTYVVLEDAHAVHIVDITDDDYFDDGIEAVFFPEPED